MQWCDIGQHKAEKIIIQSGYRICKDCIVKLDLWDAISPEKLREAGWSR